MQMYSSSLRYLRLSSNQLTYVDLDLFSNFPQLFTLDFNLNQISSFTLTKNLTVKHIKLSRNSITNVDLNDFIWAKNLSELNFMVNPVTHFKVLSKDNTINLEVLKMQANVLNITMANLDRLESLTWSLSPMTVFDYGMFSQLPRLTTLALTSSEINQIAQGAETLPMLETLTLNRAKLTGTLNLTVFGSQYLPKLTTLIIEGNMIDSLSSEMTQQQNLQPSFDELNLKSCAFSETFDFTPIASSFVPNLKTLYLDQNSIESLIIKDGYQLESLDYLSLTDNHIKEVDVELFVKAFKELSKIYLTSNYIQSVSYMRLWLS